MKRISEMKKRRGEKMVDLYKKYYLDDERIRDILKNGVIVFDTSALLDLYYYSLETRTEIFEKAFGYLNGRLWMPAQVHFEYLKNKEKVAEKPISSYQRLISKQNKDGGYVSAIVDKTKALQSQGLGEIKNQLKTLKEQTLGTEKHPYLSPEIYAEFENALSTFESSLTEFSDQADKIQVSLDVENIQALFDNIILRPVYIIDALPQNETIRLFDNPYIFEAEDENGQKIRIMATLVGGGNYARVLHGMTNAFELKKFYERNNEHYWYYNFIIAKNKSIVDKVMEHMGKTKVRKMYANHSVHTAVCYFNEDQNLNIVSRNFEYGQ